MTANQIAYQEMLEKKRANKAQETETHRRNLADEDIKKDTLSETARSNRAKEANTIFANTETARANRAKESLQNQEIRSKERISYEDRRSKENIASADRSSRENIATADRSSREAISTADRLSREDIANQDRISRENISHADRTSREGIASADRVSRERMQSKEHAWSSAEKERDRRNTYKISDMTSKRQLTGTTAQVEANRYATDKKFITDTRNREETIRSNKARESETQRHNKMIERYEGWGLNLRDDELEEKERHNKKTEAQEDFRNISSLLDKASNLVNAFIPG